MGAHAVHIRRRPCARAPAHRPAGLPGQGDLADFLAGDRRSGERHRPFHRPAPYRADTDRAQHSPLAQLAGVSRRARRPASTVGTRRWPGSRHSDPARPQAALAFVVSLVGYAGGMVMAAIKRDKGVADWGHLLPGRGRLHRQAGFRPVRRAGVLPPRALLLRSGLRAGRSPGGRGVRPDAYPSGGGSAMSTCSGSRPCGAPWVRAAGPGAGVGQAASSSGPRGRASAAAGTGPRSSCHACHRGGRRLHGRTLRRRSRSRCLHRRRAG